MDGKIPRIARISRWAEIAAKGQRINCSTPTTTKWTAGLQHMGCPSNSFILCYNASAHNGTLLAAQKLGFLVLLSKSLLKIIRLDEESCEIEDLDK